MLGVTAVPSAPSLAVLRLDPPATPGQVPRVVPADIATLADLAMSSAIRKRLRGVLRLGTTSLTVQFVRDRVTGIAVASARFVTGGEEAGSAHATCVVRDVDGRTLAVADAWFVVLPLPPGKTMPQQLWEKGESTVLASVTLADLNLNENEALKSMTRVACEAEDSGITVSEALLAVQWREASDVNMQRGSLRPGPALTNRVGHVQGGALFGIGALAAERAVGTTGRIVSGHLQYLCPTPETSLEVAATVLRRGKRASFVKIQIGTAERSCVEGLFTLSMSEATSIP